MTPADVREMPAVRTWGPDGRADDVFACRAPLPMGVYPDAPTALRALLVAAPRWLTFLVGLLARLRTGIPAPAPRRWGRYAARQGDRLGPLRVTEAGTHRVTMAAGGRLMHARLAIEVSDGAVTARTTVRTGARAGRVAGGLAAPVQRMVLRALLGRAAALLAARAQTAGSILANTTEPAVANTIL